MSTNRFNHQNTVSIGAKWVHRDLKINGPSMSTTSVSNYRKRILDIGVGPLTLQTGGCFSYPNVYIISFDPIDSLGS